MFDVIYYVKYGHSGLPERGYKVIRKTDYIWMIKNLNLEASMATEYAYKGKICLI